MTDRSPRGTVGARPRAAGDEDRLVIERTYEPDAVAITEAVRILLREPIEDLAP